MKKLTFLFTLLCLLNGYLYGQTKRHFEHYGIADGLPQRSVMSILQDKKGFMWFATWDGLCKFNGYNFTSYKSSDENVIMRSNRIDYITEDAYGYIWAQTYNDEIFRFDPLKEEYTASFQLRKKSYPKSKINAMPSGKTWLTSIDGGAICVLDSTNVSKSFTKENSWLASNHINSVYEDKAGNSWILTNKGLTQINPTVDDFKIHFTGDKSKSVFSAYETDTEIWFGCSNGDIKCYNKDSKKFALFNTGTTSDIISIKKIYDNLLVILTSKDGFIITDTHRNTLKIFNKSTLRELPTNEMISCFVDRNNNIWIETASPGIGKFSLLENRLKYYQQEDLSKFGSPYAPYFFIMEDKAGHVWIHFQGGGLYFYNQNTDQLLPFNQTQPDWQFSDMLHDMFVDQQGNLWLSTRSGGVEKIVFNDDSFKINDFSYSINDEVRALFQDKFNNIWLSDKDNNEILIFNARKEFLGYLCKNGTISKNGEKLRASVYTFFEDSNGTLWIGSKGNGLFRLTYQGNRYQIKNYRHDVSDIYSLNDDKVYSIHEDKNKRLWIATYDAGINFFDEENERFINHNNLIKHYPLEMGQQARDISSCDKNIYIGTTLGLIAFPVNFKSFDSIDFRVYSKTNDPNGLYASDIYNVYVTSSNDVYVATFGGGLSKITAFDNEGYPLTFKTYDRTNGLYSDIILSIIEDNNNHLWLNNEGNLTKFEPENESFELYREVSLLLKNNYFSEAMPLLTNENEIIYGHIKGTLSFSPDKILKNEYIPYLAFIKFELSDNKSFKDIDDFKSIRLNHNQNIFSIEFAALDFKSPNSISYTYKLEGFDVDWINSDNQRTVNYTKLPPGKYTFKVKSTNSNGSWVDNERQLQIIITPSFWQTGWARLLYVLIFIIIVSVILRTIFVFFRMKDKVLLEQQQTEMRSRFFTDISHEIRTPLTMIVSPVEEIMENPRTPGEIMPQLQLILKNANRMLTMVNQILDFRKIQKQTLHLTEVDFGEYITEICNDFAKTIHEKNVSITVNNRAQGEKLWIDRGSIEKLVFNLISNAIKYSDVNKNIEVNVLTKDKQLILEVKDEGKGMTKDVLNKIFTRFASFNTDKSKPSTGIGLSIVKEVADKHHAKISVNSDVNKGSSFIVLFQPGMEHFADDKNVEIESGNNNYDDNKSTETEAQTTAAIEEMTNTTSKLSLLIVEDDADLRGFIKSILQADYNVYEAADGAEGYETALRHTPDFILSDIMMPKVDGIVLLHKIRNNPETSHIPFILLTAKTSTENQLEGITSGADDYITKPFNVKLLKAKIKNIIQQRKRITGYLTGSAAINSAEVLSETETQHITQRDKEFLQKLHNEIIKNLDNSDFTIDELVSVTNFSRRVFFNKLKSLTGLAPVEFIREIRIKESATLLKTGEYMVKEVAYMVGFSDIRYYTKCFKDMFGMTPSQYKEDSKM